VALDPSTEDWSAEGAVPVVVWEVPRMGGVWEAFSRKGQQMDKV
jgi:hypothetical protein